MMESTDCLDKLCINCDGWADFFGENDCSCDCHCHAPRRHVLMGFAVAAAVIVAIAWIFAHIAVAVPLARIIDGMAP